MILEDYLEANKVSITRSAAMRSRTLPSATLLFDFCNLGNDSGRPMGSQEYSGLKDEK